MLQILPEIRTDFEALLKEKITEERYRPHYKIRLSNPCCFSSGMF